MSMLAEKRSRNKWSYSPQLKDSTWAEGTTGKKMLENMGWSTGKGLGKEEQGETDPIAVRLKLNTKGVGFKGSSDVFFKHYEGFENVLAQLNSENNSAATSPCNSAPNSNVNSDDEGPKRNSLEALSKTSKSRVHYHKFTRGKDLSRYDADAIACVTGLKQSKILSEAKKKDNFQEDEVGKEVHYDGVTMIKGGTIQDYFAKKMALLKSSASSNLTTVETEDRSDDQWNDSEICEGNNETALQTEKNIEASDFDKDASECASKHKKKKKSKKNNIDIEEVAEELSETKKKRKKNKDRDSYHASYENYSDMVREKCSTEDLQKKRTICDDNVEDYELKKPKKKKKTRIDVTEQKDGDEESENVEKCSSEKKKKKKCKGKDQQKEHDVQEVGHISKKSKKKKKKHHIDD